MKIKSVEFVKSSPNYKECPINKLPEIAFIGRSNVGKSSLINMLLETKVAKTSQVPGKTQLINHFLINEKWYLVDLPGYGWAKLGKEKKEKLKDLVDKYFANREQLTFAMVLVDSRLEPQPIDLDYINLLGINNVPIGVVFTKSDKVSKNELNRNVEMFKKTLMQYWKALPEFFFTSSLKCSGRDEILKFFTKVIISK